MIRKKAGTAPALKNVPDERSCFLGYNKTMESLQGEVVMTINGDPFLAFRTFGKGRSAAFSSDCALHWGPPEFVN